MQADTVKKDEVSRAMNSAAYTWLMESQEKAFRSRPMIAVVQELLQIMNNEFCSDHEVRAAVHRAVRILSVFLKEKDPQDANQTQH